MRSSERRGVVARMLAAVDRLSPHEPVVDATRQRDIEHLRNRLDTSAVQSSQLPYLAGAITEAGIDVVDLEGNGTLCYVVDLEDRDPASVERSEAELYARMSDIIRETTTYTPFNLGAVPSLDRSPIEGLPVFQVAGEATALQYRKFRDAVRANGPIAEDKFAHRALLACCIDDQGKAADSVSKTVALIGGRVGESDTAAHDPEYWQTRLGALSLISSGELMVNDLSSRPRVHFTLIGEEDVCIQEPHETGEQKRQWLLRDAALARALADTAVPLVREASFISSATVRRAFRSSVRRDFVSELSEALDQRRPLSTEDRYAVACSLLAEAGVIDPDSKTPVPAVADSWLTAVNGAPSSK